MSSVETFPLAPAYERVVYVGHAIWDTRITRELFLEQKPRLELEMSQKTGYRCFLRDVQVQHFFPIMTDVSFEWDVPYSPKSPITGLEIIGFLKLLLGILALIGVIGFIVWLFWTSYVKYAKTYVCDQCPDYPSFEGELSYRAHLKQYHPEKYSAYKEGEPWWEKLFAGLPEWLPLLILLLIVLAFMGAFRRD